MGGRKIRPEEKKQKNFPLFAEGHKLQNKGIFGGSAFVAARRELEKDFPWNKLGRGSFSFSNKFDWSDDPCHFRAPNYLQVIPGRERRDLCKKNRIVQARFFPAPFFFPIKASRSSEKSGEVCSNPSMLFSRFSFFFTQALQKPGNRKPSLLFTPFLLQQRPRFFLALAT